VVEQAARRWLSIGVLAAVTAVSAGGCELLGFGGTFGPGADGIPSPIATYENGHATVTVSGADPIELATLELGAELYTFVGARLTWSSPNGWYLTVEGAGAGLNPRATPLPPLLVTDAYLVLDRIVDNHHWTTQAMDRCKTTIKQADKSGLRGTSSCHGLQWLDYFEAQRGFDPGETPSPVAGQQPFDVEITFEAS
jgi:hypothetical protein